MSASLHSLTIAGTTYRSRLLVGTGKYKDFAQTREAIDASGANCSTGTRCANSKCLATRPTSSRTCRKP